MATPPYRTLLRFKRWATNGLNGVIAEHLDRLPAEDQLRIRRLLDHVQTVDDIFSHNLEARPHGHRAPRSPELPGFDVLAGRARATADWYVTYVEALPPTRADEAIDFTYANGEPARMTRGEMLLHVATHAGYHRGQIGEVLQKHGIQPWRDRLTDFLESEAAAAGTTAAPRPAAAAS